MKEKCVLAYSGGLDTSVILHYLVHFLNYDVTTFTANLGQSDLRSKKEITEKAKASGASRVIVEDLRDRLVLNHILPGMQWGATYAGGYHLCCSLARPLTIQGAIEAMNEVEGEIIFSHGATGKGNDQVRFELGAMALRPGIKIYAPWKDEEFRKKFPGRDEMLEYAEKYGIPVSASIFQPWSNDGNIGGETYEAGDLENLNWHDYPEEMFKLTRSPENAPSRIAHVRIAFQKGRPVSVNGGFMLPLELIEFLNEVGGENGVGRTDTVEWRRVGMQSRGVYEEPALHILWEAYAALERLTLSPDFLHLKDTLRSTFSKMVYFGEWFTPAMQALMAFGRQHLEYVTGEIKMELYKGNMRIVGRYSPNSLYKEDVASMHEDDAALYNQNDAEGYIKISGLPIRIQAKQERKMIP